MVAAEVLGLPVERINVEIGDSDRICTLSCPDRGPAFLSPVS